MDYEDKIIELIQKFNTTGEIDLNEFARAALEQYPTDTVLSIREGNIVNWGTIDSVERWGSGDSYGSTEHCTIQCSRQTVYYRSTKKDVTLQCEHNSDLEI